MLKKYLISEKIYKSRRTQVYKAIGKSDGLPVVLKVRDLSMSPESEAKLTNEYQLGRMLGGERTVRYLSIENEGQKIIEVMQDDNLISLNSVISETPVDLTRFFVLAMEISLAIEEVHRQGIVHKDIKPSNIIVDDNLEKARLIDFEIATRLSKQYQTLVAPIALEGTLSYSSPEQTGRLPFKSKDPIELVHGHIAKVAIPVNEMGMHPNRRFTRTGRTDAFIKNGVLYISP